MTVNIFNWVFSDIYGYLCWHYYAWTLSEIDKKSKKIKYVLEYFSVFICILFLKLQKCNWWNK